MSNTFSVTFQVKYFWLKLQRCEREMLQSRSFPSNKQTSFVNNFKRCRNILVKKFSVGSWKSIRSPPTTFFVLKTFVCNLSLHYLKTQTNCHTPWTWHGVRLIWISYQFLTKTWQAAKWKTDQSNARWKYSQKNHFRVSLLRFWYGIIRVIHQMLPKGNINPSRSVRLIV